MGNNAIIGIDVSEHNGFIDWDTVKKSGKVGFAILRAGYGKGVVDKQFHRNAKECNRLDIPIGVYWFSYAKTVREAAEEASYCIDTIEDYKIDYPVAFDFEDDSVVNCKKSGVTIVGKSFATSLAINFLSIISKAGYVAANYTNPAYLNQYFDQEQLRCYDLWLAQWPANPSPDKRPVQNPNIWQFSSIGTVPGIVTKVDMNACYTSYVKTTSTPVSSAHTVPSIMTQEWAQEAVKKAVKYGISDGSNPDKLGTRVETMAMITRAFESLANLINDEVQKAIDELSKKIPNYNDDRK